MVQEVPSTVPPALDQPSVLAVESWWVQAGPGPSLLSVTAMQWHEYVRAAGTQSDLGHRGANAALTGPGGAGVPLCLAESDLSKPPCYEEALLMAEPPPPYSEVLMDTRGLYRKINAPFLSHERLEKQEQPPSYKPLFLDTGYGSALHLPRSASPGPACPDLYLQAECSQRMFPSWTDSELSSRDTYEPGPWHLPVSMPLFGRTTAV
ncbi:proline-rich protein 7 [Apteryx rowi]|uniref:proline-rich protein 7 n=1 Tax=Apteryx rowi TaxID=308060 RepID=UPI000E1D83B7|nr:proline-rich protein 7 [Apteryx rowi]